MWQISKSFTFEAAHRLPNHDGKCRNLHGHSWKGVVYVQGDLLQTVGSKQGMIMDYSDIKAQLKPMIEQYLDHHYLNESLSMENPTSEAIAEWIFNYLAPLIPGLLAVAVEETCTSRCVYTQPTLRYNEIDMGRFT